MNFDELFYKPKRLAKKTKYQKLRIYALFLSVVTTLGILGYIVNKNNKKSTDSVDPVVSIESVDIDSTFNLESYYTEVLNKLDGIYNLLNDYDFSSFITIFGDIKEDIEKHALTEIIEENVTSTEYIERALQTSRAIREFCEHIPNEVEYDYVVNKYFNSAYEFDVFQGTIGGEAKHNSYEDGFASITSVFNRNQSYYKCSLVRDWMHIYRPITLYDHITCDGQYSVYLKGTYKPHIGVKDATYQAVLDFLYTLDKTDIRMHDLLNFRSSGTSVPGAIQFVRGGDKYFTSLTSNDTIPFEDLYFNIVEEEVLVEDENSLVLEI